ncbi:TIGR02677 family protein [Moorella sp. Hama-1]|nr:TIGR02677 family protein [Moorella sp. Hama-1]
MAVEQVSSLLKAIPETSYLTAQNVGRYRCIMRFFYLQHQRLRYWLRPEDVYQGVRAMGLLPDYTLELCQQDLNQLVEWQDLVPRHDGGRACTVEEYLRKRFRYQMTPYAVEIERLVLGLEKVRGYGGSLEPSLFETIAIALRELEERQGVFPAGEAGSLWEELYGTFVRLTENASDYIASLQSAKAEELMATEAFLAYKDAVTGYLQSFVQGLQRHAFKIEGLIPALAPQVVAAFLDAVTADIGRRPQLDEPFDATAVRERLEAEWQSLVRWFVGTPTETSDVLFLEQATKDTIARLVRNALQIQEKRRSGVSRRRELDYLGRWFFSLDTIEEAHCLAAYAFGLYRTRHFQGSDTGETDNPDVSMWEVGPNRQHLRSRSRRRLHEGGPEPVISRRAKQEAMRAGYLEEQRREQEMLLAFLRQGAVTISRLGEVTPALRQQLLYWISRCQASRSRSILTPEGIRIALHLPRHGQRALLRAEDGTLDMPDYTLLFTATRGEEETRLRRGAL